MAETTDLLSEEDITDIGSVIKLAPHSRSSQFETVTKSSDGQTLVSLDELYEKTGQESINRVVEGFKMAQERNKLARAHGEALNVQGAESWTKFPDQLNVVRGYEGFFTSLKDGIVTFVKAIIRFIKGVYNWIAERFKRLFGFEKTMKEVQFLNDNTVEVNAKVANLIRTLGGQAEYSPEELFNSLETGKESEIQLSIIKSRLDSNAETFKRIATSIPAFHEALGEIKRMGSAAEKANRTYRKAIDDLKRKFKNKDVNVGDINTFVNVLEHETMNTLDQNQLHSVMALLTKEFYGIEIKDLGLDASMAAAREELKKNTETVRMKSSPEMAELAAEAARTLAARMNAKNPSGLTDYDIPVSANTLSKFSDMIGIKDAEFIKELSIYVASKVTPGVDILPQTYAVFCTRIREYSENIELLLTTIQNVSKTYINICQWYSRLSLLLANYVSGDAKKIMEANEANLTPEEYKDTLDDKGNLTMPIGMEKSFDQRYPGWNMKEDISRIARDLQEVEQVSKPLNRFITTMRG